MPLAFPMTLRAFALSLCFAPPLALRLGHPLALALAQRGLASFLLSYYCTAILDH